MSVRIRRPSGITRAAFRLPIRLYHRGLGWLLDHRFMMLTHRGRKSGRLYETVLEVPYYDPATHECFVMSGWGDKTDWYRNIQAQPAVRVQIGRESFTPTQRFLTQEETARVWAIFRRKHPIEERIALRLYATPASAGKSNNVRRQELLKTLRVVAFRPAEPAARSR